MVKLLSYIALLLVEPILSRIIGAIGFGFITYAGIGFVFNQIQAAINSQIGALSAPLFAILAITGFGQAISIVLSALSIRMYLNGMNAAGNVVRTKWTPKE